MNVWKREDLRGLESGLNFMAKVIKPTLEPQSLFESLSLSLLCPLYKPEPGQALPTTFHFNKIGT